MIKCGRCGYSALTSETRLCPQCGAPVAPATDDSTSAGTTQTGTVQAGAPADAGPAPVKPPATATPTQSEAPTHDRNPRRGGRGMVAVVGLLALAVAALVSISVYNWWLSRDGDSDQPGWLYQEGLSEAPDYGLAIKSDEGFQQGPKFSGKWVMPWDLVGEKGNVLLPKFGSGYAAMTYSEDADPSQHTSRLELADGQKVVDLDGQTGRGIGNIYADMSQGVLYYTLDFEDVQSCRVIRSGDAKPFEVATGRDCRWAPDGRAVATDWSQTSASFRVFDATGKQLVAGQFPAGNYEESGAPGWLPSGGWIWATGTDAPVAGQGVSKSSGEYRATLRVLDLDTGQSVASVSGLEVSLMAAAEQGRGMVVAVDDHKRSLDAVYLAPDGTESARISAVKAAQAVMSEDGTHAWVAGDDGSNVKVSHMAPGVQPQEVLKPAPKAVRLLRARDDRLMVAAQGNTPEAFRVLWVTPTGDIETILEGTAAGLEEADTQGRAGAEAAVGLASVGGVDLITAPATSGPWSTIWQVLPGKVTALIPEVNFVADIDGSEPPMAAVIAGAEDEDEMVVVYRHAGREEIAAVLDGQAVALGSAPDLTELGIVDGKFWYNVRSEDSDRLVTKKVALNGEGPEEDVNLTLAGIGGTTRIAFFSRDGAITTAWTEPSRAE